MLHDKFACQIYKNGHVIASILVVPIKLDDHLDFVSLFHQKGGDNKTILLVPTTSPNIKLVFKNLIKISINSQPAGQKFRLSLNSKHPELYCCGTKSGIVRPTAWIYVFAMTTTLLSQLSQRDQCLVR